MICINCGKQLKHNEHLYCKECLSNWLGEAMSEKLSEPFICQVINKECPNADIWQYGDCKSCKEKTEPEKDMARVG